MLLRWNKKEIFIFKGLSVAKKCLRPENGPLNDSQGKIATVIQSALV